MESSTDREWKKWGATDPYYGVLGYSTQSVADPDVHRAFLATGRDDLGRALNDVERLFGPVERGSALDFGCGVGRIMSAMLDAGFATVDGIDVSPDMIAEARKNIGDNRAVRYFSGVGEVPREGGYDFVHTYIVLQHIRPAQGIPLIKSLIELAKPGGAFALHLTIADTRAQARVINFFRYRMKAVHMLYNAVRGRRLGEPVMEMNRYPVAKVLAETAAASGGLYGVRMLDQGGPIGIVLMGRRAA